MMQNCLFGFDEEEPVAAYGPTQALIQWCVKLDPSMHWEDLEGAGGEGGGRGDRDGEHM